MDDTEKIQELLTAAETSRASGDFETAYDNYRAAARKGSGEAAYRLGEFYENGIHVKRNVKAAKQWYFTAAIKDIPRGLRDSIRKLEFIIVT